MPTDDHSGLTAEEPPSVNDNSLTLPNAISVTELALAMHTDEDTLLQRLAGVLHKRDDAAAVDWTANAPPHWNERIANYVLETKFPRSLFVSEDGRVVGTWIMGNDYRVKTGYYGGYPAGYLRRVKALFPDKRRVLHIFSGKVDLSALPGDTVDINPALGPTYVDDAQTLTSVPLEDYDLILADPPYSVEDAERYQTTMVKRNTVLRALQRVNAGTHIVWLDQVLPMYRKDIFDIEAVIGMVKSTNHRFRVVTVFCRRNDVST
jgi:hypothetical protein